MIVVGVCVPERRRYAHALARATGRHHVRLASRAVVAVERDGDESMPFVAEAPTDVDLAHVGAALDPGDRAIVCILDAPHVRADLADASPLDARARRGDDRGDVGARSRQSVRLIEGADLVCFVNWETVETDELARLMALVSHLNPTARIRLSRSPLDDVRTLEARPLEVGTVLERAGWVRMLNDEHDPFMTDPDVSTVRYHQLRPFHPGRLVAALERIDAGDAGDVVRSAGFCRLATRSQVLGRWEQVGSAMWLDPLTAGMDASGTAQDIAFTGFGIDAAALTALLDGAAVTAEELAAGPASWRRFADPLPAWPALTESPRESR